MHRRWKNILRVIISHHAEKKLFFISIHNMRITVTVGVLCGKNIRRHSELSMRPILNSEQHFSHRIQYVDES